MTAVPMHRRTPHVAVLVAAVVVGAGTVIRWVTQGSRLLPGLTGAALVSWGAAQVFTPAGWILGGFFLVIADRQIKLQHQRQQAG